VKRWQSFRWHRFALSTRQEVAGSDEQGSNAFVADQVIECVGLRLTIDTAEETHKVDISLRGGV
jgi:hypothetical protein